MIDLYRSCKRALAVGVLLMLGLSASAQVERPAPRVDPKIYTQPKPVPKPPVRGIEDQNRYRDAMFAADPCSIITRAELEAILKRGDTDRALVTMPKQPSWQSDGKKVDCSYSVNYENRIFPEQVNDNSVVIASSWCPAGRPGPRRRMSSWHSHFLLPTAPPGGSRASL